MKLKRIISICVLTAFLSTQILPAPLNAASESTRPAVLFPEKIKEIRLPEILGKVEERFQGNSAETVIIVQDAHAVPEAQKNIQRIIRFFQRKHGLQFIALEGAGGKLDPQIFRSFPDRRRLFKVFRPYQEKGEITGTTAAAILNKESADYYGVEDWKLYDAGLNLFLTSLEYEPELKDKLQRWNKDLSTRKKRSYSKALLSADETLQAFHTNRIDFAEALKRLAKVKPPLQNSALAAILKMIQEPSHSGEVAEQELKRITEKIQRTIETYPSDVRRRFHQIAQDYAVSKIPAEQYAFQLKGILLALPKTSRFDGEIRKLDKISAVYQKFESMESSALLQEFEVYAQFLKESLVEGPEQKALDAETQEWTLMKKMSRLELTRGEWETLKSYDIRQLTQQVGNPQALQTVFGFYENAVKRDEVFLEKMMELSRDLPPASGKLLVAGGFHAQGLMRRLKEKNVSYLLIAPHIGSLPEEIHYRSQMTGEISWKNYFKKGQEENRLYDAFVRNVRDQLLGTGETGPWRKVWRDQIIRDLAKQGRLEKAEDYTRFIDEIISPAGKKEKDKVRQFISGLKKLKTAGRMTPENILNILKPAAMGAKYAYAVLDRTARISLPARLPRPQLLPSAFTESRAEMRNDQELEDGLTALNEDYQRRFQKIKSLYEPDYQKANKHNQLVQEIAGRIFQLAESGYPQASQLAVVMFDKEDLSPAEGRILQNPNDAYHGAAQWIQGATGRIFGKTWPVLKFSGNLKMPSVPFLDSRMEKLAESAAEFPGERFVGGSRETRLSRSETYKKFIKSLGSLAVEYENLRHHIWEKKDLDVNARMRVHADLADQMIEKIYAWTKELYPEEASKMALIVYGGQGRKEMHLTSDSEGRIVLVENQEYSAEAIRFIQNATDWIFGRGSRWLILLSRDPVVMQADFEDSLDVQQSKLTVATELLDARYLAGNKNIAGLLLQSFREQLAGHHLDLTQGLIDIWSGRYKKNDHLQGLFVREPDVKEGTGGLRTLHYVRWIAQAYTQKKENYFQELIKRGLLEKDELDRARKAYKFLNTVRSALGKVREKKKRHQRIKPADAGCSV